MLEQEREERREEVGWPRNKQDAVNAFDAVAAEVSGSKGQGGVGGGVDSDVSAGCRLAGRAQRAVGTVDRNWKSVYCHDLEGRMQLPVKQTKKDAGLFGWEHEVAVAALTSAQSVTYE
jgi:hypothetical protein